MRKMTISNKDMESIRRCSGHPESKRFRAAFVCDARNDNKIFFDATVTVRPSLRERLNHSEPSGVAVFDSNIPDDVSNLSFTGISVIYEK